MYKVDILYTRKNNDIHYHISLDPLMIQYLNYDINKNNIIIQVLQYINCL